MPLTTAAPACTSTSKPTSVSGTAPWDLDLSDRVPWVPALLAPDLSDPDLSDPDPWALAGADRPHDTVT